MAMNFDIDRAADIVNSLKRTQNESVLEVFGKIASVIKEFAEENNNDLTDQLLTDCRNFENTYNSYVPSTAGLVNEFEKVPELAKKLSTLSIGEVAVEDAAFQNDGMDVDAIC